MKRNTSCRNIAKMYIHEYGLRGYIQNHLTLSLKYVFTWLEEQVFMYKSMWNIFENTCANNVCKYMCKYICIRKYMCKAQIKCLQKFWNWPLLMYIVCSTRACLSIMVFLSGIFEEDCKYLVSCVTYQMSYADIWICQVSLVMCLLCHLECVKCLLTFITHHMGQFLQGGKNGCFVSLFFLRRAFVWLNHAK